MMDNQSELALLRWWQSMFLPPVELHDKGIMPAPTANKAQLKRCESCDAAMLTEGFRSLWLSLPDGITDTGGAVTLECWATIAAALVHVKSNSKVKLASAAGGWGDGDKSLVSEMRFAQLQNAKTPDEFLRRLRRILQQVKGEVAVLALARDIQQWFAEHNQLQPRSADKRISVKWAMDYYRAAAGKK